MQVQGPFIYPPSASATAQARDRTAQILPFAPVGGQPQDQVQPPGATPGTEGFESPEVRIQPVRLHADNLYAKQALAVYEAIDQLEKREYLRSLLGVDDYA